ncbi:MAG: hypothetical protein ACO1RT_05515 [Planctomycetaceae bacterium]
MAYLAPWLFLVTVGVGPGLASRDIVVNQRVDLIELNHFIDQEGREVFRQVLFYDWSDAHRRYVVRAWRVVKAESQLPRRRWSPPGYLCVWLDDGVLREVSAASFRETWSQTDPERENRKLVPENNRIPLAQPNMVP